MKRLWCPYCGIDLAPYFASMFRAEVSAAKAKGGHARARALSAAKRSAIARKAALARWRRQEPT
jgi:hypothetical protein